MDFETLLLSIMGALAVLAGALLFWAWLDRRRARRGWPVIRAAHVQPTQRPTPTVATVLSSTIVERRAMPTVAERPRVSENPTRQWERRTNHGMY